MSSLERCLDLASLVVDSLGFYERRQNTRLSRTFKTVPPEYSPRRASRDIPLGGSAPACSPTYQSSQNPVDFRKHNAGPSSPTQTLPLRHPLLEKLAINLVGNQVAVLHEEFLSGNFSSLRNLSLTGAVLPSLQSNVSNLTTFSLRRVPKNSFPVTRLLTFLESAPELRYVHLYDSIPSSSDAPAERLIPLLQLKELTIGGQPAHSILLDHLSIPVGTTVKLEFSCSGSESPLKSYLPESFTNLHNLRHISAVNLCFGAERRFLRLRGPSGELCVLGNWTCNNDRTDVGTNSFLRSLRKFDLSRSRRLTARWCCSGAAAGVPIENWAVYQTLHSMESLHSLTLIQSKNHPFILSLNPAKNPSNIALCPNLKEIAFYVERPGQLYINELLEMAEERALRGVGLSVVTVVSMGELAPPKDVFQLRKHVSRLECKFDDVPPEWDVIPLTFDAFGMRSTGLPPGIMFNNNDNLHV